MRLPAARVPSDSVGLEIVFLRVASDAWADGEQMWSEIDEQRLPVQLRHQLAANGFRCGLIGSQIPGHLRELLDQQEGTSIDKAVAMKQDGVNYQRRFLQSRTATRNQVVASKTKDKLVALLDEDGYHQGATFSTARCVFALRTYPQGDGSVTLELVPEIEYGQPLHQWIGQEGSFQLETGLQREVFDWLRLKLDLSPGQSLLLTSTFQAKGLGRHFFMEETQRGHEARMLLIRLAHTQRDDLFDPDQVTAPLVTPSFD